MHSKTNTVLENGDRINCCGHSDGCVSIMAGGIDDRTSIMVQYAALDVTLGEIQKAITKAKALRAIHYPETPPCEPATELPTDAPGRAAHPDTDADGPGLVG